MLATLVSGCGGSSDPVYLSSQGGGSVTTSTGMFTQTTEPAPTPTTSPSPSPTTSPTPPPAEVVEEETGQLLSYRASNGWLITIGGPSIRMENPSGTGRLEYGQDTHEFLNGKDIKSFNGDTRTVLLPDGVKLTYEVDDADPANPQVVTISIYDGVFNAVVDPSGAAQIRRGTTGEDTEARDLAQPDGETATIAPTAAVPGGLTYNNVYVEDDNFVVTELMERLGETGGTANPTSVSDYYDDPRRVDT